MQDKTSTWLPFLERLSILFLVSCMICKESFSVRQHFEVSTMNGHVPDSEHGFAACHWHFWPSAGLPNTFIFLCLAFIAFFVFKSLVFQDYRLPAVAVFNDCVQQLIQKKSYDQIFSLMKTIEGTGMIPDKGRDHLLLKVIKKITSVGEVGILFNSRH